jgi:hypothetical protein
LQLVCHVPPGNPADAHEIEVASSAVPAHLAHGDTLGPCVAPGPCTGQPDGTSCNDDNLCTINDACQGGVCVPGAQVTCSDHGACQSSGTCDPATGTCSYTPLADQTPCDDHDLCTTNDVCAAGVCQPGAAVVCGGDTCQPGVCDPASGACTTTIAPDGTACDDSSACTPVDTCQAGVCIGSAFGDLAPRETKTFTCPSDAQATGGYIEPTSCEFNVRLAFNNVFTGPVTLISHLDRDFGGFDIFTLPDGRLQLLCVYKNSDALQIGGTTGFTNASTCTPTDTSFVCTR